MEKPIFNIFAKIQSSLLSKMLSHVLFELFIGFTLHFVNLLKSKQKKYLLWVFPNLYVLLKPVCNRVYFADSVLLY